jgi:hypothetical protein
MDPSSLTAQDTDRIAVRGDPLLVLPYPKGSLLRPRLDGVKVGN